MPLHLVGETIDKARSHALSKTGCWLQLMRGVYVDADDDVEATVIRHAVRIAKYLYPNAYLSAASAVLLGPTRDGRLFLSARRVQRTRLRSLEIIQALAPPQPSIIEAMIDDGTGELQVNVSSQRQRFLEAFRMRSEQASSLDETMREAIASRLIEEYGGAKRAADAVWSLARDNEWYREGEHAERYLLRRPADTRPARNEAAFDLIVAWHGAPLGHLAHDGVEWRWHPDELDGPLLVRQTVPGKLPPFILSLLPEGWLRSVLHERDERTMLRTGTRYMSNITIIERASKLAALPPDILLVRLAAFATNDVFTGHYAGPGRSNIEQSFERNLAEIYERTDTPRLSGVQIKAPMYLDADGLLSPSAGKPFTHILKPAGTNGYEALPVIEWQALALGRAVGFVTPATALVPMPDGMAPALIVERFDIRTRLEDMRLIALEDFCSVLGVPTHAKYDGTIERVARAVRPLSTNPDENLLLLLKRALFAWLIADGDMHLKNLALLKIAVPGASRFGSVRFAPLYDVVTTRIFPQLQRDRMALKINGKDERLRRADVKAFAATAGLRATHAEAAIDGLLGDLADALEHLRLPACLTDRSHGALMASRMRDLIRARIEEFA